MHVISRTRNDFFLYTPWYRRCSRRAVMQANELFPTPATPSQRLVHVLHEVRSYVPLGVESAHASVLHINLDGRSITPIQRLGDAVRAHIGAHARLDCGALRFSAILRRRVITNDDAKRRNRSRAISSSQLVHGQKREASTADCGPFHRLGIIINDVYDAVQRLVFMRAICREGAMKQTLKMMPPRQELHHDEAAARNERIH